MAKLAAFTLVRLCFLLVDVGSEGNRTTSVSSTRSTHVVVIDAERGVQDFLRAQRWLSVNFALVLFPRVCSARGNTLHSSVQPEFHADASILLMLPL